MKRVAGVLVAVLLLGPTGKTTAQTGTARARKSPGAGPVVVIETVKGSFEFETYPNEAPKTVEHILALVRRNFYNRQRIHRVEPGFVVQFGDPQTRDMTKRDEWGTGGSGNPIGALEVSKKRTHITGAVAMAHRGGEPRGADSQMYIVLSPQPQLNSDYAVFGQVISGMEVIQKLRINDIIRRATVRDDVKK